MKMERCSIFLNGGHGPKDQICHKILSKIIIIIVNGKIIRILILVGIIISNNLKKVGNNLKKVGNNLSKAGNSLSKASINLIIGITNLFKKP
jgi:hypothetical protein